VLVPFLPRIVLDTSLPVSVPLLFDMVPPVVLRISKFSMPLQAASVKDADEITLMIPDVSNTERLGFCPPGRWAPL